MCLAVPGKIISLDGSDLLTRTAQVDFGGLEKNISLALVPDANEGDYVLVHAGIAIGCIDEQQADASLQALNDMADAGHSDKTRSDKPRSDKPISKSSDNIPN